MIRTKLFLLLIFLTTGVATMAQRATPILTLNSNPIFADKNDSITYARLRALVNATDQVTKADGQRLDSLFNQLKKIQAKSIGNRLVYRSTRSFVTLEALLKKQVSPDTITRLSIADYTGKSLPPAVFECINLKELELVNTRLRALPTQLDKLEKLEGIYVYNNESGRHLKLGHNHHVRQLILQGITQQNLPRNYKNFVRLDSLELSRNIGMREFPKISRNRNLVKLNLMENLITLKDLRRGNPSLRDMNLSRNRIARVPAAIGKFPALRKLILNANEIAAVDPALSGLGNLENLGFYQNQLTAIPPAVMSLTHLRTIDLYYNKISNLDPGIGRLQNLRVLYLSHNNLSELPSSIGDLRLLEELYVHDNKLKSIPAEINKLTGLRVLRINNNFLYTLPENLVPLRRLENLDVSHNFLFQFPDEWVSLPKLQVLGLISNPWDDKEALGKVVNTLREKGVTCIYAGN
ncbi:MAG TPA: leucine-rich repeat domain-containing protein [Cyclobacteriaceae bacterium]|nr:leucine-rich repeat domain-containing protein [Cyclobacteriaceae bacterium]